MESKQYLLVYSAKKIVSKNNALFYITVIYYHPYGIGPFRCADTHLFMKYSVLTEHAEKNTMNCYVFNVENPTKSKTID